MKVVIDVADASQLQLLQDALTEAAYMRMRAAGIAARDVLADVTVKDKRPDATRLLAVIADAEWVRQVADALPVLVLVEQPPPAPTAGPPSPPAAAPGPAHPQPAGAQAAAAPSAPPGPRRSGVPDLDEQAKARLRALTVPPGARLTPGAPPVTIDGPPDALAAAAAQLEAAEALSDIAEFGD